MIEAAVFGSRGYLGRTLVALLLDHPHVGTVHPVSTSVAGRAYSDVVPSLGHLHETVLVGPDHPDVAAADVVFLAVGDEEAREALSTLDEAGAAPEVVVDLSRAHRPAALAGEDPWTYGLAELPGAPAGGATHVANPGCYPTAALLAMGPALAAGLVGSGPLIVDGKSGVSGAGAAPRDDLHFPEANESLRAYDVDHHDHTAEIQAAAAALTGSAADPEPPWPVRFTPHLVPQNRGLLATAYAPVAPGIDPEHLQAVYAKAYTDAPTVELAGEPDTANVRGSHRAQVAVTVDEDAGWLVARAAIDNLVKGGAGTAVQNMNRALGLDEHAGLPLAGVAP